MKKYVLISGFNTHDNNRGTAALGYGSISFCLRQGYLTRGQELICIKYVKKFWKKKYRNTIESYYVDGEKWDMHFIYVFFLFKFVYDKINVLLPFSKYRRIIKNIDIVAAINGGDGFSDIYNTQQFHNRLIDVKIAIKSKIPLIFLPQTIGPFSEKENYDYAMRILHYTQCVYVRDDKFIEELRKNHIKYYQTKDLSAYMAPEKWNIVIPPNSIGINVSGLCYSNSFLALSGQFDAYPLLIHQLICHYQEKGLSVFLIPHSYCYKTPEPNNDDMIACRLVYNGLKDKTNVFFIDKDLSSPQVKYVISKMSFFIGTRMHANFAAIYTQVPVFGLAYSYKFAGAFDANGLDGDKQTVLINNISCEDIDGIINKIDEFYKLV